MAAANASTPARPILKYIRDLKRDILANRQLSLGEQFLTKVGVRCMPLDLTSADGVPGSIRPVSLADMRLWLEEYKPWRNGSSKGQHGLPGDKSMSPYENAVFKVEDFISWATSDSRADTGGVLGKTKWETSNPKLLKREYWRNRLRYTIDGDLRYSDEAFPHCSAVVIQSCKLSDDDVSFVELWSVIMLAHERVDQDPPWLGVVPVTLVSASSTSMRVLHALLDGAARRIDLYKSPLSDYGWDGAYLKDNWTAMICWYLGEPCGVPESRAPAVEARPTDEAADEVAGEAADEVPSKTAGGTEI